MSKATFRVYPNQSKKNHKNGRTPFYVKVVCNGKKAERRLPEEYDISSSDLMEWNGDYMQMRYSNAKVNSYINQIKVNWTSYLTNTSNLTNIPLNKVLDSILISEEDKKQHELLLPFIDIFMDTYVEPATDKKDGTKGNYRKAIKHFKNYLAKENLNNILISEFKYPQALGFKNYMGSPEVKNSPVSTSSNIRRIKTLFNEAINYEKINRNPFHGIKGVSKSGNKTPSLTDEQIKSIINCKKINNAKDLMFYRDLFVFACLTGMSDANLRELSREVLFPLADDIVKIDTFRVKTALKGGNIVAVIPSFAVTIMKKYNSLNNNDNKLIFPASSNVIFNRKLKLIGAHADLNIELTTKIARTTCSQLIDNVGYFEQGYKNCYMGWSNGGDISDLYRGMQDSVLKNNTTRIEEYLIKNYGEETIKNI